MGNNLFKNIKNVDSEQIQNDESKNNKKIKIKFNNIYKSQFALL